MLVRTPTPFPTESLLGFVLRVSQCNGYHTPRYIWQIAQVGRGQELSAGFPFENLAKILNQDPQDLRRIAYRANEGARQPFKILGHLLGEFLYKAPLRLKRPALCLHCAQEDGHIDAFFDLSAAIACPRHKCALVSACQACGAAMVWARPALLKCKCGSQFTPNIEPVQLSVLELIGVIQRKLHGSLVSAVNTTGLPIDLLTRMPLQMLLQFLESLGEQVLVAQGREKLPHTSSIAEAALALEDWPNGFYRCLSMLGHKLLEKNSQIGSLRKQFNTFYEIMFKNGQFAQHISIVKDEFLNFGDQHWGLAVVDNRMKRIAATPSEHGVVEVRPTRRRFIPITQLVRHYPISYSRAELMIADGRIVTKTIQAGKNTRILVDLELSELPLESTGTLGQRQAAAQLGLSVRVLEELREQGVYEAKLRSGPERNWHKDELEAFLKRAMSLPVATPAPQETILLAEVVKMKSLDMTAKVDLVAALLERRLSVAGRQAENFGGLLLGKAQVDAWVREKKRTANKSSYTFSECQAITGLEVTAIPAAIKLGFLKSIKCRGLRRVTEHSLDNFNARYISFGRLAHTLGTNAAALRKKCCSLNIPLTAVPRRGRKRPRYFVPRTLITMLSEILERESCLPKKVPRITLTQRYEKSLQSYLDGLVADANALPRRQSRPDKRAIAMASGVPYPVLFKSPPKLQQMLKEFDLTDRWRHGIVDELEILDKYLRDLKANGCSLPVWASRVDKKAIAKACGIRRALFYTRPEAVKLVMEYKRRAIGHGSFVRNVGSRRGGN